MPIMPDASSDIQHSTVLYSLIHTSVTGTADVNGGNSFIGDQPMSTLAESHSEIEFYFIHFRPIRSCGRSYLGPVIKDTAGFHSK